MAVTAQELADEANQSLERATRVLPVAVQFVDDYAASAPEVLKAEAVIRFGAYLLSSDWGAILDDTIGPSSVRYQANHAAMFRNCGAASLLARHRVRLAGTIG